jgi:hypothetical protein
VRCVESAFATVEECNAMHILSQEENAEIYYKITKTPKTSEILGLEGIQTRQEPEKGEESRPWGRYSPAPGVARL